MSGNGMEYLKTPAEVAAFDLSQQQQADIHELQQQITELQAHVEVLREAFTEMDKQLISMGSKGTVLKTSVYQDALRAFDQTPKQSLASHDGATLRVFASTMNMIGLAHIDDDTLDQYISQLREQANSVINNKE